MAKHPAIFLDRDGTIIEDNGHINILSNIEFYTYTFKALQNLQEHFLLFIITNQSAYKSSSIIKCLKPIQLWIIKLSH